MDAVDKLRIARFGQDTWLMGDCFDKSTQRWNQDCSIRLDSYLGDERVGEFTWGGHEFTEDALDIRFNPHEGDSDQPILRAKLRDSAGSYHEKDKNLSERIKNINGNFVFR
ncbi:hypothetical protein N7540_002274 [Penicillium herquei]|nr:hypothetical protein N7540_002274 [Penicillium herquei]